MGKLLGIDHGSLKIGLAIGDSKYKIAIAIDCIELKQSGLKQSGWVGLLTQLIRDHTFEGIVLGLPLGLNGQETVRSCEVRIFAELLLKAFGIPVHFWDERLSSDEAESILRNQGLDSNKIKLKKDSLSAKIILQGYMEHLSIQGNWKGL